MPAIKKTATRKTLAAKKAPAKKVAAKKAAQVAAKKTPAELRKQAKIKAAKVAELQSNFKPVKVVFNRSTLMEHLAAMSGTTKKEASAVYRALEELTLGALMPRAVGEFTLPGIAKLIAKKIPAKKGGQKVISFGVERITKPKPATVRVRARLLTRVKQVALPL
jgi:hypothetical protein